MSSILGYRVLGFILLISVSFVAMVFDILPVLLAAILSALIWDFFFIPPYYTFQVSSTEDSILLLMYFIIAMVNAALTYKLRRMEKAAILKEEKENTVKLYNTLLNSLSHELRTPIAAIIAATDNLQSGTSKLTAQNKNELVGEIAKASFRLNQQVENLLNMSRLESGFIQPKKDWCDINEIVYETVNRLEENNITQAIRININPDIPLFKLDKGMLEQVLYNILINATLYTPPKSIISIIAQDHADVLEVVIEDNGAGFPSNELENVFDKFYRLKNTRTGGTGLGLSIVKGFTEAMGGSVSLRNVASGGARFTIDIPAETSYLKNLKNE
ncbi:MAG: sensor histidine kinase [Bacteroidetes bacterium 43-93]|nr:MAG: sensor histidine kinase [Bacteroidetes bacterium 43-93]